MARPGMLNLIAALVWLLVGVYLLAVGDPRFQIRLSGAEFSSGWLALVLSLYNVVRWWSIRSYQKQKRAADEAYQERQRRHRHSEQLAQPDPNFDFSRPTPPEPPSSPPTDSLG